MTPLVLVLVLALVRVAGPSSPVDSDRGSVAAAPFSCPVGTERRGAVPPDGFEVWCERPGNPPGAARDGPARTYYDDGGLAKSTAFRDGLPHGPSVEWYRDGGPARAGLYQDGKKEGTWTAWYEGSGGPPKAMPGGGASADADMPPAPSPRASERCGYAGGEREGPFVAWWPDGKRRTEGRFCQGLQCGSWTSWDEAGHELGKVRYEEIRATP